MTRSRVNATVLFTLFLLFFIQLASVWLESIYRMSLTKLQPGYEFFGLLFMLAPLVLYLVKDDYERVFLWGAVIAFLVSRTLCSFPGVQGQIVVAGAGMGAFLIVLCYALTNPYRFLQGDFGVAAGIAVLLSVTLRSWRSTMDVSMEGPTRVVGWVLVACALFLFYRVMAEDHGPSPKGGSSAGWCIGSVVGLFSSLGLIYLVLSSPGVVSAWCSGSALLYKGVVILTLAAFAAVLLFVAPRVWYPTRRIMVIWNALFVVALVGGLCLLAPVLPGTRQAGPIYATIDGSYGSAMACLMLLLSPVIIFNVRRAAQMAACEWLPNAILPVTLGMGFLFAAAFILICSNVWGYMPTGQLLRNRFYVPFLLMSTGMFIPLLIDNEARASEQANHSLGRLLIGIVTAIALLGVVGLFWCTRSVSAPVSRKAGVTIMTYNMQQGSHLNGDRNFLEQLAFIRKVGPDIIGLQECDSARANLGNVDVVRFFADSLGFFSYYGPSTVAGTFGSAILSRYPLRNCRTFFTYSEKDEVGTAVAEIDVDGVQLLFLSNHPAGRDEVTNAHVDGVLAEVAKYDHVIAVGDYNFTARESFYGRMTEVLDDSAVAAGEGRVDYHGAKPNLKDEIDHIFVSRNIKVLESHYLHPPESQTDHPAHWAVVEVTGR